MRLVALLLLIAAPVVHADAELTATQAPAPVRNWNIGAGLGFTYGFSLVGGLGSLGGVLGSGVGGLGTLSTTQPSTSALIERRLGERLFLSFQASASYVGSQASTSTAHSRNFAIDGQLGLRRIFNPGGLIEVSWFVSARVGWLTYDAQSPYTTTDPNTGASITDTSDTLAESFSTGAVTGLVFERELLEGLALRFSSSILGGGYTSSSWRLRNNGSYTRTAGSGGDFGLRFSPTIELRYAF